MNNYWSVGCNAPTNEQSKNIFCTSFNTILAAIGTKSTIQTETLDAGTDGNRRYLAFEHISATDHMFFFTILLWLRDEISRFHRNMYLCIWIWSKQWKLAVECAYVCTLVGRCDRNALFIVGWLVSSEGICVWQLIGAARCVGAKFAFCDSAFFSVLGLVVGSSEYSVNEETKQGCRLFIHIF